MREKNREVPSKTTYLYTGIHPEKDGKVMEEIAKRMRLPFSITPSGEVFEITPREFPPTSPTPVKIKPGEVGVKIEYPAGPKGLTEFWREVEKAKQGK